MKNERLVRTCQTLGKALAKIKSKVASFARKSAKVAARCFSFMKSHKRFSLPVLAAAVLLVVMLSVYTIYCIKNPVVAEYDGNVAVIVYKGKTLYAVDGDDWYSFEFGEYLGRVSDRLYGANFYKVKNDLSGSYYAVANGTRRILYTESGELTDGTDTSYSNVSRIVVDGYRLSVEGTEASVLAAIFGDDDADRVAFFPNGEKSDDETSSVCIVGACYGGSAVMSGTLGRVFRTNESLKYYFVEEIEYQKALEALGGEEYAKSKKLVLEAIEIESYSAIKILRKLY